MCNCPEAKCERLSPLLRNNSHPLVLKSSTPFTGGGVPPRLCLRHIFLPFSFVPSHTYTRSRAHKVVATSRAGRRNANSELFADRSLSMSALEVLFLSVNYPRTPRTDTPRICIPTVKLEIISRRFLHSRSLWCLSLGGHGGDQPRIARFSKHDLYLDLWEKSSAFPYIYAFEHIRWDREIASYRASWVLIEKKKVLEFFFFSFCCVAAKNIFLNFRNAYLSKSLCFIYFVFLYFTLF